MPEVLIGDILCRQPNPSSVTDRGEYLSDYVSRGAYRPGSQIDGPMLSRWKGTNLGGQALKDFIFDLSGQIDQTWEQEYRHSEGNHLDLGVYSRVALIAHNLALNVMTEAMVMASSNNPEESRVGRNVLFHRYFNSALAAISLVRLRNAHLPFDPARLLEQAVETTSTVVFSTNQIGEGVARTVHQRVKKLANSYLTSLTGLPFNYFNDMGAYRGLRRFVSEYLDQHGVCPSVDVIDNQFPHLTDWRLAGLVKILTQIDQPASVLRSRLLDSLDHFYEYQSEMCQPADVYDQKELAEQIEDVLDSLSGRERRVLQLHFGLDDGWQRTLEEVGRQFGVISVRIGQIEAKAMHKLTRTRRLRDYALPQQARDENRTLINGVINALQQGDGQRALGNLRVIEETLPYKIIYNKIIHSYWVDGRDQFGRLTRILKEISTAEAAKDPNYPAGKNPDVDKLREVWKLQNQARQLLRQN